MPDVITFGEAMIRLSPPNFRRLEQARSLDVQVGGAELNTAVGLARLGRSAAWVSRLTDNPLGRLIANQAREAGVSTEHVVWTKRTASASISWNSAPRRAPAASSTIARTRPSPAFVPAWYRGRGVRRRKWFHVTGITPALSAERRRDDAGSPRRPPGPPACRPAWI